MSVHLFQDLCEKVQCAGEYDYLQKPYKSNFKKSAHVCAGVGKMKRRRKSKKPNWLVWQQLQQHRPSWRYWFIFCEYIFSTANATNDNFELKKYGLLWSNVRLRRCSGCTWKKFYSTRFKLDSFYENNYSFNFLKNKENRHSSFYHLVICDNSKQ